MKKIFIVSLLAFLPFMFTGCSNISDTDGNGLKITKDNKREVLNQDEYIKRLTEVGANTITPGYYEGPFFEDDEYSKKYENSDIADRERFRDFIKEISKFRLKDEKANKYYEEIIETSIEIYSMLDELVELEKPSEKYTNLTTEMLVKKDEIAIILNDLYDYLGLQ